MDEVLGLCHSLEYPHNPFHLYCQRSLPFHHISSQERYTYSRWFHHSIRTHPFGISTSNSTRPSCHHNHPRRHSLSPHRYTDLRCGKRIHHLCKADSPFRQHHPAYSPEFYHKPTLLIGKPRLDRETGLAGISWEVRKLNCPQLGSCP